MRDFIRRTTGLLVFVGSLMLLAPVVSVVKGQYELGIAGLSSSGSTITSTVPILLTNGSAAAPSLSFSSETNTGLYYVSAGTMRFVSLGTAAFTISGGNIAIPDSGRYGFTTDTFLYRDGSNNLQLGADAATAAAQTISAADSTGAGQPGGQLNLSGGTGGAGGEPGAVAIVDGGAKPTCAVGIRGSIWYDAGGAGVADTIEICAHKSDNSYAWVALATPIS